MTKPLNDRIEYLEEELRRLKSKLADVSRNVEETSVRPYSKVGGGRDRGQIRPVNIDTGLGQVMGGNIVWNDSELIIPPYGEQPATPTKGYNKHSHSRYSGGAIDINSVELVEYERNDDGKLIDKDGNVLNEHCSQFWKNPPVIETTENSKGELVEKKGKLADNFYFDADTKTWKFYAVFKPYEEEEE